MGLESLDIDMLAKAYDFCPVCVVESLAGMKSTNIIRDLSLMARWLEDVGGATREEN